MKTIRRAKPKKDYDKIYRIFELSITGAGLPAVTREFKFAPPRRWKTDFAWPDFRLILEVEGGAYTHGRHTRGASYVADMEKYNELAIRGFFLLRVTPGQVETGEALQVVERWFVENKRRSN